MNPLILLLWLSPVFFLRCFLAHLTHDRAPSTPKGFANLGAEQPVFKAKPGMAQLWSHLLWKKSYIKKSEKPCWGFSSLGIAHGNGLTCIVNRDFTWVKMSRYSSEVCIWLIANICYFLLTSHWSACRDFLIHNLCCYLCITWEKRRLCSLNACIAVKQNLAWNHILNLHWQIICTLKASYFYSNLFRKDKK